MMNFSLYNPSTIEEIKQLFTKTFSDSEGENEGLAVGGLTYDLGTGINKPDLW